MTIYFKKEWVKDEYVTDFVPGDITFIVDHAEEKHTEKAGYFIKLYLTIFNEQKQSTKLNTFLFFTQKSLWSANTFCKATGQEKFIANERVNAEDFIGLEGKAQVKVDDNGYLKIARYYPRDTINKPVETDQPTDLPVVENKGYDDLPF